MSIQKAVYLVDGIYPQLSHFVKTISIPIIKKETTFAGWQEAAWKDVEHTFGVLQIKWRLLASPVDVGQGMYSGHGYFMHYPAQHDGTAATRRWRGVHGGLLIGKCDPHRTCRFVLECGW